jgi:8-oxo-dGTP diphosphatase
MSLSPATKIVRGVVVACWDDLGRLLVIRRSRTVRLAPLKVCFPGGGIELDETPEAAAVREMREELGVDVELHRCVWQWDHPDKPLRLWGWSARLLSNKLQPNPDEVDQAMWLTPDEIANHPDGLLSNRSFVESLLADRAGAGS